MSTDIQWGADCLGSSVPHLPRDIPAIWPYVTGTTSRPDVAWTDAQIKEFPHAKVTRINQGFASPSDFDGDEFDVELGAWTVAQAAGIVQVRRARKWSTRFYCVWAAYGAIKQQLARLGIGRSVYFRIADWSLSQPTATLAVHDDIYAVQWASPTSNPGTNLPGTGLTLAQSGADLNVIDLAKDTGWQG